MRCRATDIVCHECNQNLEHARGSNPPIWLLDIEQPDTGVETDAALFLLDEHIYTSPNHESASADTLPPAATAAAAAAAATKFLSVSHFLWGLILVSP
jgi:hypothetical protein